VLGDLLAQQCAFQLAGKNVTIDVVTWIPPTKRAIQRRGYDHAGILAQRVALQLGAPSCQFLARRNMRDLRSLSRSQRLKEAQDSYRWSHEQERKGSYQEHPDFSGKSILIVDDVLTTGATLNGAAQMFLDAGATSVIGAVLARAW
jgi:predicted amidophosphoribosyltransferase